MKATAIVAACLAALTLAAECLVPGVLKPKVVYTNGIFQRTVIFAYNNLSDTGVHKIWVYGFSGEYAMKWRVHTYWMSPIGPKTIEDKYYGYGQDSVTGYAFVDACAPNMQGIVVSMTAYNNQGICASNNAYAFFQDK
jgi:hypothetical protein